jgi:hypothetical protein
MKDTMTFISYDEENGFKVSIMLETEKGQVPYEIKNPSFINSFPLIMKKLMEGKKVYLDSYKGYIGSEQTEGPYCDEQVFMSDYDDNDIDFLELLDLLEQKIMNKKTSPKKLVKVGSKYIDYENK